MLNACMHVIFSNTLIRQNILPTILPNVTVTDITPNTILISLSHYPRGVISN